MLEQPTYFLFMFHYFITVNLLVVLYGCKTWSLTLTEEYRPRMFKIFGPKGDKETSNLYDLYSSNQEE